MNGKKFCFLIATNKEEFYSECMYYIGSLQVPEGYAVECVPIRGAAGMAAAYNAAMRVTDAGYKIYMHQDVFILNRHFLFDLLTVFGMDPAIGMVGVSGIRELPQNMMLWGVPRVGSLYGSETGHADYAAYAYEPADGLTDVAALDGLLMASRVDVRWREDLFDGWDLYDISQSMEFRRRGYRLVVPEQKVPWVYHDKTVSSVWNYNKYRKIFQQEYLEEARAAEG
ncbi:MAG: glycosyltransferase family protein [Lachnospiraceae bacterium]|nr:glycosyltransferase family protein [Lachnospiraceae bacterium]